MMIRRSALVVAVALLTQSAQAQQPTSELPGYSAIPGMLQEPLAPDEKVTAATPSAPGTAPGGPAFGAPAIALDPLTFANNGPAGSRPAVRQSTGPTTRRVIDLDLIPQNQTLDTIRHSVQQEKPGVKSVVWEPGVIIPINLVQNLPVTILLPEWESVEQSDIYPGSSQIQATRMAPNAMEVRTREQVGFVTKLTIYGRSGIPYVFTVWSNGIKVGASREAPDLQILVQADNPEPEPPVMVSDESVTRKVVRQRGRPPQAPAAAPADPRAIITAGLSAPLRGMAPDTNLIAVPHRMFEKHPGDNAAIGPYQVIEFNGMTLFDFGQDTSARPRPAISYLDNGIDKATANFYSLPEYPSIVVADRIGSFTMQLEDRIVCILRDNKDSFAGLKAATGGSL